MEKKKEREKGLNGNKKQRKIRTKMTTAKPSIKCHPIHFPIIPKEPAKTT